MLWNMGCRKLLLFFARLQSDRQRPAASGQAGKAMHQVLLGALDERATLYHYFVHETATITRVR